MESIDVLSPGTRADDTNIFELSREALDDLPFGVVTLDRSGIILRFNQFEETLAHRGSMRNIGLSFFNDVAPCTNVQAFRGRFDAFAREHDSGVERFAFSFVFRWGRQDVSITMLRKAGHEEINILVHARSLIASKTEPASAPAAEALAPTLDAPLFFDVKELARPVICRLESADWGQAALSERVHADDLATVTGIVSAAARDRTAYAVEYRSSSSGGQSRILQEHGSFESPTGAGQATIVDVTEQRHREASAWRAAHYDALTGLPNQKLLLLRVADAIREAERSGRVVALLLANIEQFRNVNDTFGHETGDAILAAVALRLGEGVRGGDTVARLTGDAFVVLLSDLDSAESAAETATRLVAAVAAPFVIADHPYYLALRIGISLAPYDSRDPRRLLHAAETAIYAAKAAGRNSIRFYSNQLALNAATNLQRQNELRDALSNDEFELVYQPLVDIGLDRVVATEALIRWNHPTRGLVSPLEFIPLADQSGLIVPLGEWVLRTACRQAREWVDAGHDLRVCINVSAVQFKRPTFVDVVAATIAEFELAPGRIELELTESIMVDGFSEMMETLARLKSLGLRLAIDDFGTGYSSLSYLKYFPVDTLKVDRAFITDIVADEFDHAIASAILQLAASLRLECVVEGVETVEQLETLRKIGATIVQGYYFCKPSKPANLRALLASRALSADLFAPVSS